jgi:hypothetical protein
MNEKDIPEAKDADELLRGLASDIAELDPVAGGLVDHWARQRQVPSFDLATDVELGFVASSVALAYGHLRRDPGDIAAAAALALAPFLVAVEAEVERRAEKLAHLSDDELDDVWRARIDDERRRRSAPRGTALN